MIDILSNTCLQKVFYHVAESISELTVTGPQLRGARGFLGWSAQQLADASKVGIATIWRAEKEPGQVKITPANAHALRQALEAAGVEFIPENGGGAGVRLRKSET